MEPSISVETVTPEMAKKYLALNGKNRPLGKSTLDTYAGAMRRGEWMLNGESIKFSSSGRLLDGQHRLTAVARSGVAIRTYVARDVPERAFQTLDAGKKRLGSDALAILGEKNTAFLATAARWFAHVMKLVGRTSVTTATVVKMVDDYPSLRWWANKCVELKVNHFMPGMFAGVLAAAHQKHSQDEILTFLEKIASGANLDVGDPALILRGRFLEKSVRGQKLSDHAKLTYCIKALNAHLEGKKIGFLRFSKDEEVPELI
jgi:hypothetical protein